MTFRSLMRQALHLARHRGQTDGPIVRAALLRDAYGAAAELMTEDSKTLTVLRESAKEAGYVER